MLEIHARPELACKVNVLSLYCRESRRLKPEQIQIYKLPPLPVLAPLNPSVIISLLQNLIKPDLLVYFLNVIPSFLTAAPYLYTVLSTEPAGLN